MYLILWPTIMISIPVAAKPNMVAMIAPVKPPERRSSGSWGVGFGWLVIQGGGQLGWKVKLRRTNTNLLAYSNARQASVSPASVFVKQVLD